MRASLVHSSAAVTLAGLLAAVGLLVILGLKADAATALPRTGPDYSGTYDCTGHDHQGRTQITPLVLTRLNAMPARSDDVYALYGAMRGETSYAGYATLRDSQMSLLLHSAPQDSSTHHHGTATVSSNSYGQHVFHAQFSSDPHAQADHSARWLCVQR